MSSKSDRIAFVRQGENGMEVEICGDSNTLRSMFHSALKSHQDLRSLLMPVIMMLIQDDEFKSLCISDMVDDIGKQFGLTEPDDEEPLDTN